jgi:hypothetical protein
LGENIKNTFLSSLGVVGNSVPNHFVGSGGALREEFAGASGNTRKAWEHGEFAIRFIFSRKDLIEVLGISGDLPFSFV